MPSRVLAIGDVHGCLTHLSSLLDAVSPKPDDHLIFLGDYVDRGPDSAGVLQRVMSLRKTHQVTALMGNHEEMMLNARMSPDNFTEWTLNGGDKTLISYAGTRAKFRDVPADHWHFLETELRPYFEDETHIFVHANAYPDLPMAEQPDYILRWERCDQSSPHSSGKIIVCGHTPQKSGHPLNRGHLICLDTYACGAGGALSCMDSRSGRIWQAYAQGPVTRSHISEFEQIE